MQLLNTTILMGELNTKADRGKEFDIVGSHDLGIRNKKGDLFVNFSKEKTGYNEHSFQFHPQRLYTWKDPADNGQRII